ncbi:hypothetical protein D3C81_1872500 [compost metagenome]
MSASRFGVIDEERELLVHLIGDTGIEYANLQRERAGHAFGNGFKPLHHFN